MTDLNDKLLQELKRRAENGVPLSLPAADTLDWIAEIERLRATPAPQAAQSGQKPLPTPEQLLAVARDTGLRSYLHGVNATEARELLSVYIDAVRQLDTSYLPAPSSLTPAPQGTASGALERFAAWKGYPLPALNSDGQFDKDYLHREYVAFKAGLAASLTQAATSEPVAGESGCPFCGSAKYVTMGAGGKKCGNCRARGPWYCSTTKWEDRAAPPAAQQAPSDEHASALEAIGKKIGYGRACQILGELWDTMLEREYGRPSSRGKMERRRDIEEIEAFLKSRAALSAQQAGVQEAAPLAQQSEPVAWRYQRDTQARPGVPDGEWRFTAHSKTVMELQGKTALAANSSYHCWQPLYAGSAPASPVPGDADELKFNATRLRNVARLVGLESAVPQDDATLDGARGSVLGLIAGKLRAAPASTGPCSDDTAKDAARWRETLLHIGGMYSDAAGVQRFTLRYLEPVKGSDILKGSAAEHFTQAIDAALSAAEQGGKA